MAITTVLLLLTILTCSVPAILYTTSHMASPLLKTLVVPAASGTATASVIFAHGLGDSGLGWLDVAKMLSNRPSLRHVRFVLPNAPVQPVTLNMGMSMPAWFDITTLEDMGDAEDEKGLLKSSGEIKRLIQAEIDGSAQGLAGNGIQPGRVVVGGFSQICASSGSSSAITSTLSNAAELLGRRVSRAGTPAEGKGMGIFGIGVDVMHRTRLASLFQRHGQRLRSDGRSADSAASLRRFARRILCEAESVELASLLRSSSIPIDFIEQWLAVRWTAKEAAYKAVYPSLRVRWSDLEVGKAGNGEEQKKPQINLSEEGRVRFGGKGTIGLRMHLSGGAIAYLAGLTHPTPLAGIIGLSTWLPLKKKILSLSTSHAKTTPVFHGHGSSDQIVQFEFGKRTVEFLQSGDIGMGGFSASGGDGGKPKGVRFEIYRGMQHSACPEEIEHVGQFLETVVPKL